jgi:hypothetical protein
MDLGGMDFIVAIIAITTLGWIITTAIRARHGYPLDGEWGGTVHRHDPAADEVRKALIAENHQLKASVGKLEQRLEVLERIATDPTRKLHEDIELLR